jgi:hypothetical protein
LIEGKEERKNVVTHSRVCVCSPVCLAVDLRSSSEDVSMLHTWLRYLVACRQTTHTLLLLLLLEGSVDRDVSAVVGYGLHVEAECALFDGPIAEIVELGTLATGEAEDLDLLDLGG